MSNAITPIVTGANQNNIETAKATQAVVQAVADAAQGILKAQRGADVSIFIDALSKAITQTTARAAEKSADVSDLTSPGKR